MTQPSHSTDSHHSTDATDSIHSFAYRNPRLTATLPVEFLTEGGALFGHTRDISEGGLLVDFGEPVLPHTTGGVRLRLGHCVLELHAEVTHTEGFTAGLVFAFSSPRESAFIRAMLQALTAAAETSGTPAG